MKTVTIDTEPTVLAELEAAAYARGDTLTASLCAALIDAIECIADLENTIADTRTLEEWEKENGPAYEYVQFFHSCFESLGAHYPCPNITSDYDQSVIFDAIRRGDEMGD